MLHPILRYLLVAILLMCCFNAEAKYEHLLHKTYGERYRLIDSLFYYNKPLRTNAQAFFKEISLLADVAKKEDDKELECEAMLLSLAYNSANVKGDFTKVEPEAYELIKKSKQYNLTQIELRCRQFLGRYYLEKTGRYIEAIDQFLKSYYLMRRLTVNDFPTKREHMYNVAHAYYIFGDFAGAKKYLTEAENIAMPDNMTMIDDKNKISTFINLENTLGLIYRHEHQYDSAIHYFEIVKQLAAVTNDSVWLGIASGNIGICYYLQKRYAEAIPLLEFDIEQSFKGRQLDNGVNSLIKLADIYLQRKEMPVVRLLLDSVRKKLDGTFEPSEHMQHLGLYYARYYAAAGNTALAYRYMDSAREATLIIDAKKNALQLANQQLKMELQEHRTELQKAENDKRLQILKRNSVIVGVLLLAVFSVLFINRQKKLYLQKSKLAEFEKNRARMELQGAKRQLQDFTKSILEKNELIEKFSGELSRYQPAPNDTRTTDNPEIIRQLQQSILLTDEQWEEFRQLFEKVHTGYLQRLKQKLPDLTPAEIRFVALCKLKLSNKEMAGVLGIGLSGMRNYKYRLRKKLNLPAETDMDEMIQGI